ncbi:usherin isoform X2 [Ascaphus truei]|uniref:usherin isoform X2 n=1 Tax=Ascaphus truei TaxID=8439 RepID=UPI003F598298
MHYLAPIRDVGALLHVLEIFLVGYYTSLPIVSTQGQFPKLENVGALKLVTLVPPQATCGLPERSIFCHSDRDIKNIHTCTQRLCIQECPYRAVSPAYHDLILLGLGTCVIKDKYDLHPGFTSHSTSFIFYNHKDCLATPPPLTTGVSFTLTVWLKPEHKGVMCVIEKSADGQIVFKLTISEKETVFYYRTVNGLQPPIKVMTQGRFLVKKWIHLSVQVHHTRISFFINGLEEDGTAFDTRNLSDPVSDTVMNSTILLGQSTNGLEQFVGRMQDFRLYQVALTNREIVEVFSKEFPSLHVQSECRCPSSHPRIHPLVQRFCIPNGADDTTKDRVLRLNPDSHALSYVNDNDLGTTWISSLFSTSEIDNNITITIDLENGQYQVFYVILQFYSPLPQALRVQRKKHKDSIWEDWQYFASDCQYFGMDNNGFLQYPDSVNCLQLPKDTPFSRGNVTLSILTPEPNPRPGYNDFYNTQYLQEFVKASQLRIQLFGQYYTEWSELSNVNLRHRYYGVNEITVSGRCNCHGHAHSCDTSLTPYRCLCDKESHTYGDNCDGCLPLFNNKPFRRGDQVNAYNCRSCECNDHSISCHYNVTLDPYPYDHNQGGGGVCDNCLHNTTGKNCELCKDYFYRQVDSNLSAIDVCKPCDCNEAGTIHRSLQCEKIGGQCNCKRHVFGRQCNQCKDGFYNLRQSHSEGCIPCRCNTSGTVNGDITCNQNSGECKCKSNVIGLWCDRCNLGFKQQNMTGKKSCIPCKCHTLGSINQYCNPISGLCKCREDVKGLDCDTCIDNYYGLDAAGCKHCDCDKEGIIPGTVCDAVTGQCVCQPNIGGRKCNECLDGYFKVQQNNSVACLSCKCDMSGTIHSSQSCEKSSGQCFCKTGVTGQQCNVCMPHMYNLTVSNHLGCQDCDCHPLGILASTVCDQMNGQCKCLPNYQGRRCNQCMPGFYFSSVHDMRCVSCLCHTTGSRHGICNSTNGQCVCQDSSLTGQRCDQCSDLFFGFDSDIGSCQPCDCNAAGAIKGTCHSTTGQCFCKRFVRGFKCDQCIEDASSLDVRNPYGCSTTPYQQPPPKGSILNSTVIILMWSPPDSPNTNKINYILYRDGLEIYATTDHHPYSPQSYTDISLLPYTAYFYYVDAKNVHGFASSTTVMYRTKAGAPIGDIYLNHISPAGPYSASLNWTITSNESGPIEKFRLINTSTDSPQPNVFYEGPETLVTVHNLAPFKKYNFSVQACTIEGCLQSLPVTVVTGQAPPAFQNPPVMQNSSSTDLHLQWFPPFQANGIIIRYELYMRGVAWSDGNHIAPERRVFHASGWLNPQPVVESQNENALMPPPTSATVSNLEPNTEYEFCIVTTNMAGITASEWVTMITAESAPVFMPPPSVFPLSSQSLNVSWERANNSFARGKIIGYTINAISEHMPDESHTEATSEVLYVAEDHELFYILTGLKTYHAYTFTITLCNTVGCVTSKPGTGQTLAAAPEKINAPLVNGIDSTVMKMTWVAPLDPNGPSPMYQIERIEPSLTIPSKTDFIKGTRFPGNGYFKFPTSTFPVNTYFTGIKVQFRTKEPEGLILCAVSAGMQEEYFALQIRNGRPYFLFDPQGSAVAVSPSNDGGRQYNDNNWHQIIATRNQATGKIIVDGQYTGSSLATSGGTIIGENTGVFVGGFPNEFVIKRKDTGDAQISQNSFVGCLRDISIQQSDNPQEIWEALEWYHADEKINVYDKWEGCPDAVGEGAYFLGFGFLELYPSVFPGGPDFELSFMFKTDQLKGLLLFIYNTDGPDYLTAQLKNGILSSKFKNKSTLIQVNLWAGLSYCDGRWNKVILKKEGALSSVHLNNLVEQVVEYGAPQPEINVNSAIYIGGVPAKVQDLFPDLDLQHGFGGCMKDVRFTQGVVVNFASASSSAVRVNLDGCLSTDSSVNCRGNDSIIVYKGKEQTIYESGLQPFTEYLYRVIASNEGGSGTSGWSRGRTRAPVPQSVSTPLRVLSINGYSAEVTWTRPAGVRGVIEKYILKAYAENRPNIPTISDAFSYTSKVSGSLKGLLPFTKYAVTLSICTLAGCTESSHTLNISTLQEAPGDVQMPMAESFPNWLHVYWSSPKKPNGIITQYILYLNGSQIYIGNETEYNVSALATFTPHQFLLTACTVVGCTNSSQVTLLTAQLPPDYVFPPILTVLDSSSIYVQWKEPKAINGILERYILLITSNLKNIQSWNVIYNSNELFLDYTIRKLFPGTKYFIKISACTEGGCTTSDISSATTEESSPEGVQTPKIQSYSPDSFNISWSKPERPNGIITGYGLYMNGILMQNSSHLSYFVDELSPWSKHLFRLQACTAKGCALGPMVEAHTQESKPEGKVLLHATTEGPSGVRVKWQGPEKPNGQITYTVIFDGLFYEKKGNEIDAITNAHKILYSSQEDRNKWVSISGLVPFSNYSVHINASNSRGHVISDFIIITMSPGAPDGVLPPRLSSATPTSLQVVWSTPVRNNAPGLPSYRLQMRPMNSTNEIIDLFAGPTASLTYTVKDLQPFTTYELRVIASNRYGDTNSNWISMSTEQDKPGPIDSPLLSNVKSRSITINWQHPPKPNGVITHYKVYQNGNLQVVVPGNSSNQTVLNLNPYTIYRYKVEGCTSVGCSLSLESLAVQTLPEAPSCISSPYLYSDTPTSVVITWQPPLHPNGLIEKVIIERRVKDTEQLHTLVTLPGNSSMQYIDQTIGISPWKTYEYRIRVTTINGGINSSAWSEVTTQPSRPAGVQPPEVTVLGPDTAKVTWKIPLIPNGDILSYEIRMPDPQIAIINTTLLSHTVTNLIPYTNYSVTIVACSGGGIYLGGCTESLPTYVTTHPTLPQGISPLSVTPISETFIAISWQPPSRLNGPHLRYELLRRKILQPLASNPPEDLNRWQNIYSGTQWFYEDKGLSRYTSYEYRLIVHNVMGYTPSKDVTATTMAGVPLRGSDVTAFAINHTAIEVEWSKPSLQDLQGEVEHYTLVLKSFKSNTSLTFQADVNCITVADLYPNTRYQLYIQVFNGAHSIDSGLVQVTTLDGEPEGIFPPEVFVINSTAVRVIWTSPSNPNGVVTQYSIYVNNKLYKTEMKFPEPLILGELFPFTVYSIQVEACTVYACVTSNSTQITTIEGMPSRISSPNISSIHSRSVQIDWASPEEPNGIILGYDLRRKTLHSCAFVQKLTGYQSGKSCLLIRCRIYENICGDLCYHPDNQVCCNGVLHNRKDGYQCCEDKYTSSSRNSSGICCGGQMNVVQPEYQCCGGYYTRVQAGNICCYNKPMNSVSIGDGDSCCGGTPFLTSGNQICCGETLHDSFNQQCCGGKIIGQHFICCGDKEKGMLCCGTEYVNISESTCCSASSGECKVHLTPDNRVPLKCCETELIPEKEECCNGVGYIPMSHVCSDKVSAESKSKGEECLSPVLCPISLSATAYCGRCDFNPATESCFWTKRPINSTTNMTEGGDGICPTEEQIIYIGGKNKYTFTDTYLDPFTTYEYRVSAWNSFGQGFSNTSRVTTKQYKPQGVSPPRWAKVDNYEDTIFLNWKEPDKANGIVHYVVLRDRMERFRGRDQNFTDKGRILPFGEYTYQLRACTMAGCTESAKVVAAINQGVPEKVSPPVITTANSTALHLSWTTPTKPNGSIREYQIHEANKGLIYVSASGRMQYTYTGLQPYKNYSFLLTACTSAGCTSSKPYSSQTLQDAPQGVWSKPCHVIINATALELYWREPEMPNGIISQYRLIRNKAVISTISGEYLSFTDVGLQPNSRYFYQLEASTVAGSNTSDIYVIQTPVATPEEIHDPYNITVIGPYSIFIAWDIPGVFNSSMPLEFNVFFHAGSNDSQVYSAGMDHFILVEDLKPYIQYDIRIQACQNGSCGVGTRIYARTAEAPPGELNPPLAMAIGFKTINVRWAAPREPNGIITRYLIHRRLAGKQENMLVFIWSEGILEYIDSSNDLQHYTAYEYRVTAHNSKGSMESVWSLIHTLEAAPQDMEPPNAQAMSAYSVIVKWTQPANPNGPITHYRVICQESPSDPTLSISAKTALTVLGTSHQANVFGLLPFTTYQICIEVFNNAGNVSSPGTSVQTLEASPSGLSNFTVETKDNGTALLLEWTAPIRTNGVIQVYNILSDGNLEYSGLSHQFLFRRLEPYTVYTLVLEACTAAGCTRTLPQLVQTDEAPPASQLPAIIQFLNATHIELSWPPPIHPNGKIKHYNVIKRDTQGNVSGNRKTINEKVVFTESNTESNIFIYIDEGLHPWTNYEYKIRAWNSAGYTDSAWTVVQTSQAAPNSLQPPKLFHAENSPHQLLIQWAHPEEENGIILSYRLKKNHILFPFSFDAATFSYTDENVLAYSVYSYAVIACTLGGCTTSDPTTIRTLEAPPAVVNPPTIESVSSTEVNVTWTPPLIQNGDITKYIIQLDNEKYFVGKQLSKLISNLQPFTLYVIRLVACTNGGCNSSLPASVRTMEAPPSDIKAPSFKVTGAESIEITWQIPEKPNGEIRSYELRRDQHLIFVGSNTHYHDFALTPGMEYSYTISANNSQGSTTSPPAKIKTHSASPSGMGPPKMQAKSANEILVTWNPPSKTNGDIINYTLSIHYPVEMEINRYNFNNSFTSLMSLSFIIKELKPYHWYEAKVGACTLQGCASSEWATGHTLEAPPESQPPPLIDLQKNQQETHLVPLMIWNSPQHPNGKIIRYELYRRQVTELQEVAVTELVYNGSSTSFKDVNVLSYTEYEYQIWSVNSAGRTPSTWTYCRTGPAPPEGIHTPTFHTVSSTLAVANITPPTKPNGIVSLYRLFSTNNNGTDTVLAEGTSNMQTIYGLKPFTNYSVGVEVCTCMKCCRRGHVVQLTTQPAPPSHQAPPRKTYITSRAASFHWDKPRSPNGIIQSYEIHMQTTCTQPMQIVVTSCAPGSPEVKYTGKEESCNVTDLQPYTNYSLRVVSYNSVGSTASDWISFITQKEKPVYKANFHVTSNLTAIFLDWSLSFLLNGHLKEYVLTDRGQRLYSGFDSNVYIQRTTDKTFILQVTCTTDMGSTSTPMVKYNSATGLAPVHPFPSAKNGTEARGKTIYTELWFIILMAFLGLLLLAVFLSLLLQKKLSKQPYVRERPPLSPLQQRMSPASGYLQNDTSVGLSDTKIPGLESHSSHNMSVVRKTSKVSHSFSQNSLYRSASQLLTTHDKKSLVGSSIWDSVIQGHDSGMCVDDEDLISTIKCFSTVTKQNTAFTDTPL